MKLIMILVMITSMALANVKMFGQLVYSGNYKVEFTTMTNKEIKKALTVTRGNSIVKKYKVVKKAKHTKYKKRYTKVHKIRHKKRYTKGHRLRHKVRYAKRHKRHIKHKKHIKRYTKHTKRYKKRYVKHIKHNKRVRYTYKPKHRKHYKLPSKGISVKISAYTSHRNQCDSTPFITAISYKLNRYDKRRVVAVSHDLFKRLKGKKVILKFYKNHKLRAIKVRVVDLMNSRYRRTVDLYYHLDIKGARHFGRIRGKLVVLPRYSYNKIPSYKIHKWKHRYKKRRRLKRA